MTTSLSLPRPASDASPESATKARAAPAAPTTTTTPAPHLAGMLWFAGWLFTIGFSSLVWWKAALALVVWPYFLGITVR